MTALPMQTATSKPEQTATSKPEQTNHKSVSVFKTFSLLHQNGKSVFFKTFHGEKLDQSFSLVFASSLINFTKTLLNEEIRDITSQNNRIFLKEIGQFVMILHCSLRISQSSAQIILKDMTELLELLFGPATLWDEELQLFNVSGAHDILSNYFNRINFDPFVLSNGISKSFIPNDISEKLDKLLGALEIQQQICGNGTMLTLGHSVVHSRMPLADTKRISQFLKARPLAGASIRYTPIYTNDGWHTLYCIRIQTFVLSILCYMEVPLSSINHQINLFETALTQSRIDLPAEETPILLRTFVKRETLALLYHNMKSRYTIFPNLRPASDSQQKEILDEFWTYYGDAIVHINSNGIQEYTVTRDSYRFYCKSEGIHRIYLLLSNDALISEPSQIAADALKNIKLFIQ